MHVWNLCKEAHIDNEFNSSRKMRLQKRRRTQERTMGNISTRSRATRIWASDHGVAQSVARPRMAINLVQTLEHQVRWGREVGEKNPALAQRSRELPTESLSLNNIKTYTPWTQAHIFLRDPVRPDLRLRGCKSASSGSALERSTAWRQRHTLQVAKGPELRALGYKSALPGMHCSTLSVTDKYTLFESQDHTFWVPRGPELHLLGYKTANPAIILVLVHLWSPIGLTWQLLGCKSSKFKEAYRVLICLAKKLINAVETSHMSVRGICLTHGAKISIWYLLQLFLDL